MSAAASYTLFETAIGRCGIAWRSGLVVSTALPGADEAVTARHLLRRLPDAREAEPEGAAAEAIDLVRRLLDGEAVDLSVIPVDLGACPDFERRIYALLRDVPTGRTVTYGELAVRAGSPGAARAVGMAMGRNPVPIIVPCHRVLASSGRSGGFSAPGGVTTKFRILQIEQAGRSGEGSLLFDNLPLAVRNPSPS
ncbi:MAG: methylated-DNA--[protein]-cysteine S-methyltransferase [Allosphingosinicella sp.]|uniref:methylated-DNA--[protein]-cysteine S-methyltransferase n=1 Tax=Allosphingosinicella sp. TaxID=2823234 RepID=UPI00392BBF63